MAEFHVSKLQRLAIDWTKIPIEDIAAELERRAAELVHDENGSARAAAADLVQ